VTEEIESWFPGLSRAGYEITSEADIRYNCIAWAANESDRWWWPDPMGFGHWPVGVPRAETVEAFVRAYQTLGYELCEDGGLEPGFEKVALFVNPEGRPSHAARQLSNGRWTSKLGRAEDIEHALDGLVGGIYGTVAHFLRRPQPQARPRPRRSRRR
jgi:hypothetical protein